MAQERDELLDHEYDGIREYDNPLPRWWLWLFYGTIIFSAVYIPYYLLGFGPSTSEMYEQEVQAAMERYPRLAATQGSTESATSPGAPGQEPAAAVSLADPSVVGDAQAIAAGKEIYTANCLPCHGDKGQGLIGPNLTDNYWLHGNEFADIVNVITNGVPDKGMIAWKSTLNPQKINQVAAFVTSLRGTNPPNPKPPQGQEYPQ